MKKTVVMIALLLLCLLPLGQGALASEMVTVQARDGCVLTGKLDLPAGPVKRLVLFVNGSGPNTYDNTRQLSEQDTFTYYDLFAQELTRRGLAFCRFSTRGCTPGDEPPMYVDIDEALYQTYVPENSINDVEDQIAHLLSDERLAGAQVYLLGWSEGTMIAPQVALRANVPVHALVLCGYVNGTMMETLTWQQTGGSSMVVYRQYFDADGDGVISRAEFAADPYGLAPLLGATFDEIDLDGDGELTEADFAIMLAPGWAELRAAIERGDDAWLKDNYAVRLTGAWFQGHEALTPNREVMPLLDLPIYIFHGACDANASVEGVRDIQRAFERLKKINLSVNIYPDSDHDLNYAQYLTQGAVPREFRELFDTCARGIAACEH